MAAAAFELMEHGKTAAGRRMLAGAEGEPGVDLEIDASGIARVGRRVNGEAAGADRLKPSLAHRYPIRFAKLLDLRRATAEAAQDRELFIRRRMFEISVD